MPIESGIETLPFRLEEIFIGSMWFILVFPSEVSRVVTLREPAACDLG